MGGEAENGAVRHPVRWTAFVVTILCTGLWAQNQDRDTSRASKTSGVAPAARVDINQASLEELLKVPGLTRTWAARVVRYRPYRTKGALLDKGVLSPEVYDRIKDYVIAHREKP